MTFSLQNQVKKYIHKSMSFLLANRVYVDTIAGPSLEKGIPFLKHFFILILTRAPLL